MKFDGWIKRHHQEVRSLRAVADEAVFQVERMMTVNLELKAKISVRDMLIDRLFEVNHRLTSENQYLERLARRGHQVPVGEALLSVGYR